MGFELRHQNGSVVRTSLQLVDGSRVGVPSSEYLELLLNTTTSDRNTVRDHCLDYQPLLMLCKSFRLQITRHARF